MKIRLVLPLLAVVASLAPSTLLAGSVEGEARLSDKDPVDAISDAKLDKFWSLIERSGPGNPDEEAQADALRVALRELPPHEIEQFALTFDGLLNASYSWKLWGAAYLIMGGASDDGFEYFRVWLISRGRDFFERAVADPDSIAVMLPSDFDGYPEFELLVYVATEVWEEKTGGSEFEAQPAMIPMREPDGEMFPEDPDGLAEQYPKLYARFGENPL